MRKKIRDAQISLYVTDAVFPGLDEKQDTRVDTSEISDYLLWQLRHLGNQHGPLGVARAAAALTDISVLIRNLGGIVSDSDAWGPPDVKSWTTPALLNLLGALHDELDRRGVDLNDHPEYRQPGYTAPTRGLADEDRRRIRRDDTRARGGPLSSWAKEQELEYEKSSIARPCPALTRQLEGIALRAARKAIADHLGED